MEKKRCKGCGAVKEISLFYRHPYTADARMAKCKECVKKAVRANAAKKPMYDIWRLMKRRCEDPRNEAFPKYGARGIRIYPAWSVDWRVFEREIPPRPGPEYTLDRKDNDGDYAPGNVRWATRKEQARNRRNSLFVELRGLRVNLAAACEENGVQYVATHRLIFDRGWSPEEAILRAPQAVSG